MEKELIAALLDSHVLLVRALHESGALPIKTLVEQHEKSQAFGQAAFDQKPTDWHRAILDRLKALQTAYSAQSQPPLSPPTS